MFDNGFDGPIPLSFSQLTNLRDFQLQGNQLTGPLWEDVAKAWTNLGKSFVALMDGCISFTPVDSHSCVRDIAGPQQFVGRNYTGCLG